MFLSNYPSLYVIRMIMFSVYSYSGHRQETINVTADDVVITNVENVSNGVLITFFVRGGRNVDLNAPAVAAALMVG